MTIYKNDPNNEILYTSKNHTFLAVRNIKIRKNKKHKITFLEFFINQVKSGIKPGYERGCTGNLQQFQCYTM